MISGLTEADNQSEAPVRAWGHDQDHRLSIAAEQVSEIDRLFLSEEWKRDFARHREADFHYLRRKGLIHAGYESGLYYVTCSGDVLLLDLLSLPRDYRMIGFNGIFTKRRGNGRDNLRS